MNLIRIPPRHKNSGVGTLKGTAKEEVPKLGMVKGEAEIRSP